MGLLLKSIGRRVHAAPVATFALALLSLAVLAWPGVSSVLELDRAALGQGEFWRVATGHLTHYSLDHLAYDLIALVVLGVLCERRAPGRTRAVLLAGSLGVTAAVLVLAPDVERYRGLSGLDSALFALLLTLLLRTPRAVRRVPRWVPLVAAVLFAGKLAYELFFHGTTFVDPGSLFLPVPVAHLAGATIGLLGGLLGPGSEHLERGDKQFARFDVGRRCAAPGVSRLPFGQVL